MRTKRIEICSCGYGLVNAENGQKVKGLADHFRTNEKYRQVHHQQYFEVSTP